MSESQDASEPIDAGGTGDVPPEPATPRRRSLPPPSAGEDKVFIVGDRLRDAVAALGMRRAFFARTVAVTTLSGRHPTATGPAQLQFSADDLEALGQRMETYLLLRDGRLRIWLAGLENVPPGVELVLTAITNGGDPVTATSRGDGDMGEARFELLWPDATVPSEIGLTTTTDEPCSNA